MKCGSWCSGFRILGVRFGRLLWSTVPGGFRGEEFEIEGCKLRVQVLPEASACGCPCADPGLDEGFTFQVPG